MQEIIIAEPYKFVPAIRGRFWPRVIDLYLDRYHRSAYKLCGHEVRGIEKLTASIRAGHGVLVTPNHCRPSDPTTLGWLTRAARHPMYCMASWHLFMGSPIQRWVIRRAGGFSVYRKGADSASLNFVIQSLLGPDRPVVIFPEGALSRSNDVVRPLLDGTAVIARLAARKRAKLQPPGKVVVHPMAMKYYFLGDVQKSLAPVLEKIERRLSWQPQADLPLLARVRKLGNALLCLRELEYFDGEQTNDPTTADFHDRIDRLIEHILTPLETEYVQDATDLYGVYARVQRLRSRIVPKIIEGKRSGSDPQQWWRQLADCYVAQLLGCYPRDYLGDNPPAERLIETVERLEEDLTDVATNHGPMFLVMQIGDAIEVGPDRKRGVKVDPLTAEIHASLTRLLATITENPPSAAAHKERVSKLIAGGV